MTILTLYKLPTEKPVLNMQTAFWSYQEHSLILTNYLSLCEATWTKAIMSRLSGAVGVSMKYHNGGLYQGCQSVPLLFNLNWVIFASSVNLIGSSSHDPCSNKTYTVLFYTRSFWDKSWKAAINNRGSAECLLVRRAFVYGYWTDTARCTFLC